MISAYRYIDHTNKLTKSLVERFETLLALLAVSSCEFLRVPGLGM